MLLKTGKKRNWLMKKSIYSTILAAMLITGCGGSGGSTSSSDGTKTNTKQNSASGHVVSQSTQKLKYDKNGRVGQISTEAPPRDVTSTKDAIITAEGKNGVEIIKIGYNDALSSDVVAKIKTDNNGNKIDAKKVTLSEDEQQLLIEKADGRIVVVDISNLSEPKVVGERPKRVTDNSKTSKSGYRYIPMGENGMKVINLTKSSESYIFNSSSVYDIVLIDHEIKALAAIGAPGIQLLEINDTPLKPTSKAIYTIEGTKVTGLSLSKEEDILFVATGDQGVLVFNLDILLDKLSK